MVLEQHPFAPSGGSDQAFVADAMEAVRLKFVDVMDCIDEALEYAPEFTHQQFGETEKIVGYKNLSVRVLYTDCTLFSFAVIKHDGEMSGPLSSMRDDIEYKIRDTLPSGQLNALQTSMGNFVEKLKAQKQFSPPGELLSKIKVPTDENARSMELQLYKVTDGAEHNEYLERVQALAYWFIEDIVYTDNEYPRYFHYLLFESIEKETGGQQYRFAGYATLYRFFHYPNKERIRIAQILVAPQYRHSGIGSMFLNSIYKDLMNDANIYDITSETPADNFLYMRDFLDCVNCSKLDSFKKEALFKGYNKKMEATARNQLKINARQARRVYEILRLYHTNWNLEAERNKYRDEVLKRLTKSQLNSKKSLARMTQVVAGGSEENNKDASLSMGVMHLKMQAEEQLKELEPLFQNNLESYLVVINRLRKHEASL